MIFLRPVLPGSAGLDRGFWNLMHCLRAFLFIPFLLCASCSTITTAYYARPADPFLSKEPCKTGGEDQEVIPCARLKVDGIEISYRAVTMYHPTMRGPCLLPLYPVDAPILDSYDVHLVWRILLPSELKGSVSILKSSVSASTAGRSEEPTGITVYRFENGHDQIDRYISSDESVPETLPLGTDGTLLLWYNKILYSETKSFSVQPAFLVNGKKVLGPRVEFAPAKDRRYSPYEFPFMFAPVR